MRACLGRGRRTGAPRQPGGTCYSEVAFHTCHSICPGLWTVSLSLALGVSCSDLLLSPSSASSSEFPSSESLGWLVSAHLGVWDISEAWLQDSKMMQEGLPLKLSGLGAPGVLRCQQLLVSPHLTLVEWPWGSENHFLSR